MSFWGAHEFRHNPKNRPPKKIPHEDCTAGIKVPAVPCPEAKKAAPCILAIYMQEDLYNAWEEDIAVVNIFFGKETVMGGKKC